MLRTQSPNYRLYVWLCLSVLIVVMDQLSKLFVLQYLSIQSSIEVTSFFNLTLLFNKGAAFSFLDDASGWQQIVLTSISFLISGLILYYLPRFGEHKYLCFSLAMILGGALSNGWDRLTLGAVIDFLHFHYSDWHFAVFNIADAAISLGTAVLLIIVIMNPQDQE